MENFQRHTPVANNPLAPFERHRFQADLLEGFAGSSVRGCLFWKTAFKEIVGTEGFEKCRNPSDMVPVRMAEIWGREPYAS